MRIFLDSNVVLTGAFNPSGLAGKLNRLVGTGEFLYSQHVLNECTRALKRARPTKEQFEGLKQQIANYLDDVEAERVEDQNPPVGVSANHLGDDPILGASIAAKAEAICTYNLKDFPNKPIPPCTPLSVLRSIGHPEIDQYIQKVELSSQGTLLFFGTIHHPGSMGPILRSANGTLVNCDKDGRIVLVGKHVEGFESLKPLAGNKEFRLTIRYKKDTFEAESWEKSQDGWAPKLVTRGAARFADDTSPVLCFVEDHKFSGHIQSISGVPRYVKNKNLYSALDNFSLEAIYGSLGVEAIVRDFAMPRGRTWIMRVLETLRN